MKVWINRGITDDEYYDRNQFQFDDFINFVDSDMPGYIQKVKDKIEKLEEEKHKEV